MSKSEKRIRGPLNPAEIRENRGAGTTPDAQWYQTIASTSARI
ncbi:MAG: hypothetical protein WA782_18705 [Sulfitobacter sp.]